MSLLYICSKVPWIFGKILKQLGSWKSILPLCLVYSIEISLIAETSDIKSCHKRLGSQKIILPFACFTQLEVINFFFLGGGDWINETSDPNHGRMIGVSHEKVLSMKELIKGKRTKLLKMKCWKKWSLRHFSTIIIWVIRLWKCLPRHKDLMSTVNFYWKI